MASEIDRAISDPSHPIWKIILLCVLILGGGSIAAESHVAFGGVKKSGNAYPSAARTFRAVTHEVTWTVNHDDKLTFPQGMK